MPPPVSPLRGYLGRCCGARSANRVTQDCAQFKMNRYAQADVKDFASCFLGIGHTPLMDPFTGLQANLRAGEQLLWHGVPDQRVWLAPADAFLIPLSIMWCAFAMFWESSVVTGGGPAFAELWGVPFIVIGAYFAAGRFAYKRYRKGRTAYGITTQRAVIADPRSFSDMPLQHQPVTVRRTRDGRHASVLFGTAVGPGLSSAFRKSATWYYANTGMDPLARGAGLPFAFYDVADPDAMLAALDQARTQPAA